MKKGRRNKDKLKPKPKLKGYKPLGTVLHVLNNIMVVRARRKKLRAVGGLLNSVVMNGHNREIGRVYDIFGPVDHPYIAVKVFTGVNLADLQNKKVFVLV